jgi:recombination protein RecA
MTKNLDIAIKSLEKEFGQGAVIKGNETIKTKDIIPTGSLSLNEALGIGGYPLGSVIEVYGPEGTGKTTLALHAIAEVQKMGKLAAFVDAEHGLDLDYAEKLGVDVSNLYFSQPTHAREALTIVETLLQTGEFGIVVVDSVASLVTEQELDGNVGDAQVAPLARLMSSFLRRVIGLVNKTHTIVFFVNQIRMKIGIMFGNPETTPGGNALKYYATHRLDMRSAEKIKSGVDIVGNVVRVKVVKNKKAPPFRVCEFNLIFGEGIDTLQEIITLAINKKFIERAGAWFKYGEESFQGLNNLKTYLKNNEEAYEELKTNVLAKEENEV